MKNIKSQLLNKGIVLFVLFSIGISSVLILPGILDNYGIIRVEIPFIPVVIIGSWVPNIAAIIIIVFLFRYKRGVRKLFARWTMWKVSPLWYLAAFSPLIIVFFAAILHGITDGNYVQNNEPISFSLLAVMLVMSLFTGAMGEELGWRGFALPLLQQRFNPLVSSLIIGSVWAFWHSPLWFTGMGWEQMSFFLFAVSCIMMSIVLTWICNNTNGNMLLVTLFHMAYNFGLNILGFVLNIPADKAIFWMSILMVLYALILLLVYGKTLMPQNRDLPVDSTTGLWQDIT